MRQEVKQDSYFLQRIWVFQFIYIQMYTQSIFNLKFCYTRPTINPTPPNFRWKRKLSGGTILLFDGERLDLRHIQALHFVCFLYKTNKFPSGRQKTRLRRCLEQHPPPGRDMSGDISQGLDFWLHYLLWFDKNLHCSGTKQKEKYKSYLWLWHKVVTVSNTVFDFTISYSNPECNWESWLLICWSQMQSRNL